MVHSFRAAVAEARRHGDLYFAALLSARSYRKSLRYGKMALARLDLHSRRDGLGLSFAMPQPRPFLPRCGSSVDRLAGGLRFEALFGRTGAYCTAQKRSAGRSRSHELMRDTGKQVEDESPETWLWHGRKVRVVDGSTITMPDTPANQAAYPQQKSQKPGCGFPIARILVIFSLSVGTVLEAAIGKYKGKQTGENSLFRELYRRWPKATLSWRTAISAVGATLRLLLATRRRHGGSQTSTPANGLSHGQAIGQGRSSGGLVPAANGRHGCRPSSTPRCPKS